MARLTARIKRLEALDHVMAGDAFEHLSDAELDARICQLAEKLTTQWRNGGRSVADITAEPDWPADGRELAALLVEMQAPPFNAERFLAALNGRPANPGAGEPDAPQ